jgi:hypothetical protein
MKLKLVKSGIALLGAIIVLGLAGCPQEAEVLSSDAKITNVKVAGVTATLETPSADWTTAARGVVALTPDKLANAKVEVSTAAGGSKVYYFAGKPAEIVVPDFVESSTLDLVYGDSLYVEVFSENHDAVLIYQIGVVSTAPIVSDITLGGRSATGGTLAAGQAISQFGTGVGIPGKTWNDPAITEGSVFYGSSQNGTDLPLGITVENPDTPISIAVVANGTTEPTFAASEGTITATDGSYLYIKADSIAQGEDSGYYKIKLVQKNDNRALTTVKFGTQTMITGVMGTHSYAGSEAYGQYSDGAELAVSGGVWNWTDLTGLNNVVIDVTPEYAGLTFTFGQGINNRDATIVYSALPGNKQVNLKVGAWIGMEVTSELGEKGWYKFQVEDKSVVTSIGIGSLTAASPGKMTITNAGSGSFTTSGTPSQLGISSTLTGANAVTITAPGVVNPVFESRLGTATAYPSAWGGAALPSDVDPQFQSVNDVADGNVVWVRLTADNVGMVHYYAVSVLDSSILPSITALNIGGTAGWVGVTGGTNVNDFGTSNADTGQVIAGSITLTPAGANNALITPTLGNGTILRVAVTAGDTVPPDWIASSGAYLTFADNSYLWLELSRTGQKLYYKILVSAPPPTEADAKLTALGIGGELNWTTFTYDPLVYATLGTPNNVIGSVAAGSITLTTAQAGGDFGAGFFGANPNSLIGVPGEGVVVQYAKTTGAEPAAWDDVGVNDLYWPTPIYTYANNDVIWAKCSISTFTRYYKIIVTVTP